MAETAAHPVRSDKDDKDKDTKSDYRSNVKSDAIKDDDPRFKFGPPKIQTAEDAVFAFLRDEIDEDEFKAACGKFGVLPGTLLRQAQPRGERPDAAFEREIPEEIYDPAAEPLDDLETRQKMVDEKNKERDEAASKYQKKLDDVQLVEQVPAGTSQTTAVDENEHDKNKTAAATSKDDKK